MTINLFLETYFLAFEALLNEELFCHEMGWVGHKQHGGWVFFTTLEFDCG
jgi:hypothetical protein